MVSVLLHMCQQWSTIIPMYLVVYITYTHVHHPMLGGGGAKIVTSEGLRAQVVPQWHYHSVNSG